MCDRLRCCLSHEYCHYEEALKNLPRRNKIVSTPLGQGKVRNLAILKNEVRVFIEGIGMKVFDAGEVELVTDNNPTSQRKSQKRNSGRHQKKRK